MADLGSIAAIIVYCLIFFVGAAVGGFLAQLIIGYFLNLNHEARLRTLENSGKSALGHAAKQEKNARMAQAIAEGAQMLKDGKKPEEVLKELAPRYPDVAMDLLKKFGTGGGGMSLEGLLG